MRCHFLGLDWRPVGVRPDWGRRLCRVQQVQSLEELMQRYVAGNRSAFEDLYRRLSPQLFTYLVRLTREQARAEDLLQVTFTKVHRARDSYLQGAPVLPWVLAIARRSFFDERRAAGSRPEDLSPDGIMPEMPEPSAIPLDLSEAVELALSQMPIPYREAIQLTKLTGLSMAEAAEVLDSTPSAVKVRVHRGYALLRKQLEHFSRGGEL